MRFAVDTGGTFTDLLVEDEDGSVAMFKAPTTPHDPIEGVLASLESAARACGLPRRQLLARGDLFIHGTTHAINAILTGNTARTAFITTSRYPGVPRGRPERGLQLHCAISRTLCAESADLRSAGARHG